MRLCAFESLSPEQADIVQTRILVAATEAYIEAVLKQVEAISAGSKKPASTGSLLGDIQQGVKLKKPTTRPAPDSSKTKETGSLEETLKHRIINVAPTSSSKPTAEQGASEQEWAESEQAPTVVPKAAAPQAVVALPIPKLVFSAYPAEDIKSYLKQAVSYLEERSKGSSSLSTEALVQLRDDELKVDGLVDNAYSKSQKEDFHRAMKILREKYPTLKLKDYIPKPPTHKPIPSPSVVSTVAGGQAGPGMPKKTFTPNTAGSEGGLMGQIAGGQSGLRTGVKPASSVFTGINFKDLSDDQLIDILSKHQNSINQLSLRQLIEIADNEDALRDLDHDIYEGLQDAARSKKDEATPPQRSVLKLRYGIAY